MLIASHATAGLPGQAGDRILVQLRDTRSTSIRSSALAPSSAVWTQRLGLPAGVTLRGMHASAVADTTALETDRPVVVELHGLLDVPTALARMKARPDVVFAEPDYLGTGGGTPNDPSYSYQWHLPKIQADRAWAVSTGSSSVIVAVLDTGINLTLSEFTGRLLPGHDYANNDNDPTDDYGHGTVVAGVLAANTNNGVLGAGVNWQCRILPEKVLDSTNSGYYSWWAQAIYDATDAGAKVINLSAGGSTASSTLQAAIDYAITKGAIFVTITHNDGTNTIRFPGSLPECITVGGTERDDTHSSFSNYGPAIDLVAPADDIYGVGKSGGLEEWEGTSFAAPQVSAVAAIIAGLRPGLNQAGMEQLLCASAEDQVGGSMDTPGWDQYFGYGRLNALYALQLATVQGAVTQATAQGVTVQWTGLPANASQKMPLLVQFSNDLVNWTTVGTNRYVTYSGSQASWTDDGSQTGGLPTAPARRFYRAAIQR